MAVRGEHLCYQQAVCYISAFHSNIMDIAGIIPLATLFQTDAIRAKTLSLMTALAGGFADSQHTISCGHGLPICAIGNIERMGRCALPHRQTLTHLPPIFTRGCDMSAPLNQHKDHLIITAQILSTLTCRKAIYIKTHIGPACIFRCDILDPARYCVWLT